MGTLNRGSHGYVHKAQSLVDNDLVALKTIDKQDGETQIHQRRVVSNEISTQTAADHPGVVKLKNFFEDNSSFYLVLELCESGELYRYFPYDRMPAVDSKKQPLPEDLKKKKLIFKLLEAVAYLHDAGIVHCDLKMGNILLDRDFNPVVLAN